MCNCSDTFIRIVLLELTDTRFFYILKPSVIISSRHH